MDGGAVEIRCRPCQLKDRHELVEVISKDVYDGHDYLDCVFEDWLADPTKNMVVCVDNGGEKGSDRVLGLDIVSTFDNGDSVMFQALRVHPGFQRRGIGARLSDACAKVIAELPHKPRRLRATTVSHSDSAVRYHQKQGFNIEDSFAMWGCHLAYNQPDKAPQTMPEGVVNPYSAEIVGAEKLWKLLTNANSPFMTNDGKYPLLTIDWVIHELTEANLKRLEKEGIEFAVVLQKDELVSFSVGGMSPRVSGMHFYAAIYTCSNMATPEEESQNDSNSLGFKAHANIWYKIAIMKKAVCIVFTCDEPQSEREKALEVPNGDLPNEKFEMLQAEGGANYERTMSFYVGRIIVFKKPVI